jgi:hypothetical protein
MQTRHFDAHFDTNALDLLCQSGTSHAFNSLYMERITISWATTTSESSSVQMLHENVALTKEHILHSPTECKHAHDKDKHYVSTTIMPTIAKHIM